MSTPLAGGLELGEDVRRGERRRRSGKVALDVEVADLQHRLDVEDQRMLPQLG
jgi:hypothetical protein